MSEPRCVRLRVHGLVQGVGFRHSLQREARRLGLAGWVRNRRDGTVEAVVCGIPGQVEALVAWARQGPALARVDRIEVAPDEGRFDAFEELPTA
jgi:acylphosphatase